MAFFDNLGKKMSQAGQAAAAKMKEVAEVAKLTSAVTDEEKKIQDNYLELGKLYAQVYADTAEGEFAAKIAAIKEAEEKIAEYREQIRRAKGIKTCEKCGAEVPCEAAFCSSCGAPMPKEEAPAEETVLCPACGASVGKDLRFCTACGKPMEVVEAEVISQETPVEEIPAEAATAAEEEPQAQA